jgi:hypothetical protein
VARKTQYLSGTIRVRSLWLDKIEAVERSTMSNDGKDPGHGDSLASWVTVSIIMVATAIGTLAFWFDQAAIVWASAVLAILSLPVGLFLKRSGYGVNGSKSKNSH